jgi:hypothetical protein
MIETNLEDSTIKEIRKVLTGCCLHTCKEPIEICKTCKIKKIDSILREFEVD